MSFIKGVFEGASTAFATGLKQDMAATKLKIGDMARIRAETITRESGKHATEFKKYEKELEQLSGYLNNDMDIVQYLVDQNNGDISLAKAEADKLKIAISNSGSKYSMYELLGLQKRQEGKDNKVTASQIVSRFVPAYVPPPKLEGELAVGMDRFFRKDISPDINKQTAALVTASGVVSPVMSDANVPVLSSGGEQTQLIDAYSEPSPNLRAYKFSTILKNAELLRADAIARNDTATVKKLDETITIANTEIQVHKANLKSLENKEDPKPFSIPSIRQQENKYTQNLVGLFDIKPSGSLTGFDNQGGVIVSQFENQTQIQKVTEISRRIVDAKNKLQLFVDPYNGEHILEARPDAMTAFDIELFDILEQNKDFEVKLIYSDPDDPTSSPNFEIVPLRTYGNAPNQINQPVFPELVDRNMFPAFDKRLGDQEQPINFTGEYKYTSIQAERNDTPNQIERYKKEVLDKVDIKSKNKSNILSFEDWYVNTLGGDTYLTKEEIKIRYEALINQENKNKTKGNILSRLFSSDETPDKNVNVGTELKNVKLGNAVIDGLRLDSITREDGKIVLNITKIENGVETSVVASNPNSNQWLAFTNAGIDINKLLEESD